MSRANIRKFCVAPMMGYTTPHARKLYRILSKKAFLFTEMIHSKTMIHYKKKDFIIENDKENPIALQVGGSEFQDLAECTKIAKTYNYDEINLNIGCPSKAVQKGNFGVCLMKDHKLVKHCLETMLESADIEVSVKCRIGIGKELNYDFFCNFINEINNSGIRIIYVHARNAILSGISPKNNRTIPLLNYDFVARIKKEFPYIQFILNGGIDSIDKALSLSKIHDGVMIGRLIQNNPFSLLNIDKLFFNTITENSISEKIILEYFQYIKKRLHKDTIFRLLSPLLNIFFGFHNSKKFKTEIHSIIKNKKIDVLESLFLQFIDKQRITMNL
jgi:tRNA-dihydrouridine synthase A|tara:strand:+ start:1640 stop:2629 length:990 start_codon:yes stop_codon:yes gene_type:complete